MSSATLSRRQFLELAASLGAAAVIGLDADLGAAAWRERRDVFPEGVASGDPDSASVILWTRRPWSDGRTNARLSVEVATDAAFRHIVASATVPISAASDWTCRALVGGLEAARVYWYRFADEAGNGSRIGRTI